MIAIFEGKRIPSKKKFMRNLAESSLARSTAQNLNIDGESLLYKYLELSQPSENIRITPPLCWEHLHTQAPYNIEIRLFLKRKHSDFIDWTVSVIVNWNS